MTCKTTLVETAVKVLGFDASDAKAKEDLSMIVSLVGPQAIQNRIDRVKSDQSHMAKAGL